jgi:hypothetical protein
VSIFEVTLQSGRKIEAIDLQVIPTYLGWLDGVPNAEINNGILRGFHKRLGEKSFFGAPVYVVEPERTTRDELSPHFENEFLPAYFLVAGFQSSPIVSDKLQASPACRSQLIIGWFQDEALPDPSDGICQLLGEVPWRSVAQDYDPWE